MTCALVTTWRGRELRPSAAAAAGGSGATRILDWHDPVFDAASSAVDLPADGASVEFLRAAHRFAGQRVRAVYALDDTQPASVTLTRGRGSCSQRLAVVEALARRRGIATKVEGLVLRGEFWYPRFRRLRALVPDRVPLAWPSFDVDGEWIDVSQAFPNATCAAPQQFTNSGEETLFDAVARSPVSWRPTSSPGCLDLSGYVAATLGEFGSRDELFARYGQTLNWPVRTVLEPVFGRRRAA